MITRRIVLSPVFKRTCSTPIHFGFNGCLYHQQAQKQYAQQRRRQSSKIQKEDTKSLVDGAVETSNITNILNELNDEEGFNSARRNVTYRTTASQLVEEMSRNATPNTNEGEGGGEPSVVDKVDEKPITEQPKDSEAQQDTEYTINDDETVIAPQSVNKVDVENYLNTHEIYQSLRQADFTEAQAKLINELMLSQLQANVNKMLSQHSPMLDLHNEDYLFQAAQQELKSQISSSRENDANLLINSSILLKRSSQSLEDELFINYKLMDNSMKLEMNQFKHENNLHMKQLDLKNQDLNNKIVTDLVGELRSYTESLRWQLTRSALTIVFVMVFLGITSYTIVKNADEEEEAREALQQQQHQQKKANELSSKKIIEKMTNHNIEQEDEEAEAVLDLR